MPANSPIAKLNDLLRTTLMCGRVVITPGINGLPEHQRDEVLSAVRHFDRFTVHNDPYGDRDFGWIEHAEAGKVFWKIDYYNRDLTEGSEDPADPLVTCRVLTIMLAEEY